MKMNKFVSILTLAFSAFAAPRGASAAGDIMDIRCVDEPGVMVFGTANQSDPFVCKPDRPLTIGDTLTIRVRMFTRNWADVKASHGANLPKTWTFKPGLLGGSLLAPPKLSIKVGSRIEGATYADSVIVEGQIRESGVPLVWDELGNPDANYTYYTDFYFQYKIKAGDLGMPITLVTNTDGSFALQNVDQTGVGQWMLVDTATTEDPTVHFADFRFVPETEEPDGWPNCGGNARKLHFRTTDLSDEGAFVKTMDFGPDDSEGAEWRNVYPGMDVSPHADPEITLNGSLAAEDNVTVYVWTESEDVAVPVGGVSTEIAPGYTRKVLAVTVRQGDPSAKFKLAGAEGAAVGAETTIYLSAVKKFPEAGTAVFENTTVQRTVKVVKAPQPTVHMYIDGTEATKTVTADDNYIAYKARLTFKVIPKVDVPVTVTFDGSVNGDDALGTLDQIFDENVLRIADANFGGDPIEQKKKSVTIQPETGTAELNVYVLGTTAKTSTKGVYFSMTGVSPVGSGVVLTDAGCTLKIKKGVPRIVSAEPMFTTEDGEGVITTVSGSDVEFALEIADTYKNLYDETTGYTFIWKVPGGEDIDPEDGIIMDDGVFTGSATFFNLGESELTLQVKAPDGSQSAPVKYKLSVVDSKKTTIAFTDPNRLVFCEGEETTLKLGLTQPYKGTGYIFLDGDAEKLAYVDSLLLTEGALIEQGKTEVATPRSIRFLDGTKDLTVKALLCTDEKDKTKKVTTFVAGTLSFTVTNKPPTVTSVTAAGQYLDSARKGQTLPREVPMGVAKTFTLTADDVPADLTNALFATKWVIEGREYEVFGDPSTNVVTHTFLNATPAGDAGEEVRVYLKDKDMGAYPANPSFYFYVKVAAKPHLDLTTSAIGGVFNEDDTANASVTLTLSEPASAPLLIKLTVQDTTTGHFRLRLADGSVTNAVDAAGNVQSNVYLVTINEGVRVKNILAVDMDGTNDTYAGLDLNAEVVSETTTSEGVAWKDYYTPSETVTIRVKNVPPAVIRPNDSEVAYTNMNASANTPYTISFGANDVKADLAYEKDGQPFGLAIDIAVDGVSVFTTNATSSAVQTTQVTFDGEGDHVVVITFTDKDQESSNRELNFYVQPSKRLKLSAHGPAPALGSSGGFSQHYASAPGLGAGRVWAGETGPQKVANFIHSYSFTLLTTTVDGWAWGYSADGKPDDGTLTPAPDRGIDSTGGWTKGQEITADSAYNYTVQHPFGKLGYDSFVYAWACNNTESESGGGNATTKTFVLNVGKTGHLPIPLPKEEKDAKSYPEQSWEAIFSRELLRSDNCGDINLDGIPDVVLARYGLGIIDPNTQAVTADSSEGDLKDASTYNLDENDNPRGYTGEKTEGDFLPTTAVGLSGYEAYGIMADIGSWDEPFTAVLEIRGAGIKPNGDMPLNDALAPEFPDGVVNRLSFSEVESESYYLDPDLHPTSTLSRVEWLAWQDYAATHGIADPSDPAGWRDAQGRLVWSPERPTLPTKVDTDGDGFPDGYEYYYWYRAHVGYMDGAIHRYLTGRRYDPRNPGEGTVITREEIEQAMDPIVPSGSLEQDTDFDGIPDLLEMLIGTDPFDFDSDGDGLPDGWEIMISATSPFTAYTTQGISDAMRNYDGDAMAFTTPALERTEVLPKPLVTPDRFSFALAEPNGDSDGVQWYVGREAPTNVKVGETGIACVSFKVGAQLYVTTSAQALAGKFVTADGRLAIDLAKDCTWEALAASAPALAAYPTLSAIEDDYVRLMPVRLAAGTPVSDVVTEIEVEADPEAEPPAEPEPGAEPEPEPEPTTRAPTCATLAFDAIVKDVNAAWIYGRANVSTLTTGSASANLGGFGMLAVGRNQDATNSFAIAALPKPDENVAYVHFLVYQEFGFDPRTAWNANTPLAARWGAEEADGSLREGSGRIAGVAARTREYTTYDEFLVYSFFLNNGSDLNYVTILGPKSPSLVDSWFANTTNPQGPGEPDIDFSTASATEKTEVKYYGRNSENGADTDLDGVPDGWELYIMAGPKDDKGKFFFVAPYGDEKSVFSPFVADAAKAGSTDVFPKAGDSDGLSERQEFAGTDSCNYYSVTKHVSLDGKEYVYSDTIVRPEEQAKWLNKFFPTDPWNTDTDGDGIEDGVENKNYTISGTTANFYCANFIYGEPADNGRLISIPGGGLNPCSVDTDQDGLPDAWEAQFAGNPSSLYKGEFANYVKDENGNEIGNPLQGLTDGMDGTVKDAYNYVYMNKDGGRTLMTIGGVTQVVDRDYDHDGLDNWQEYLTSAMRCWRYDDPYSVWQSIPNAIYYDEDGTFNPFRPESLKALGIDPDSEEAAGEFWYKTLVDKTSPIYNPHLVTDTGTGSQYYTRVWNEWDPNWKTEGAYYIFHHRIGNELLVNFWGYAVYGDLIQPWKYIGCSPIKADTDGDGMDDYYELFHGLNPLLGGVGGLSTGGGMVDVVYDAWVVNGSAPFDAEKNLWTKNAKALLGREPRTNDPKNNKYDFELFPWLAGLPGADADGDDLRNQTEAIMANLAPEAHHTDPSALWFTDSSYTNSLVSRFYRLPATYTDISLPSSLGTSTFEYQGETYAFTDCDGFYWDMFGGAHLAPFSADHWSLTSVASKNWFVSFEENEGYDTDHDGISDFEELQGRPAGTVSDPQVSDSPYRRQAMYFPGKDAALQTMPFVREEHPRAGYDYQDDCAFLQYTVECWVRPEDVSLTTTNTVIERAIWSSYSAAGDEELLRKNFHLGIRGGCWYTKFDANGTLRDSVVELQSTVAAEADKWTHLAVTYDGAVMTLYVNGTSVLDGGKPGRGLTPEYGASAVVVRPGEDTTLTNGQYVGRENKYWKDVEYPLHAIIIGASAKTQADFGGPTKISKNHLDVTNGRGWDCYKDFFKGYVDEVRIWDGARGSEKIKADMKKRYTAADALANRDDFYDQWSAGRYRYDKDANAADVLPELRFHWSFDSLPAAENPEMAAKQAHGFGYVDPSGATQGGSKAPLVRPVDYEITWWKTVLDGYMGTVYGNPAYVTWIPNTVSHLPRFDGTTLDSAYWAKDVEGARAGANAFANTAEPVSRWTQYVRAGAGTAVTVNDDTHETDYGDFKTTSRRFWQVNAGVSNASNAVDNVATLFEFTGRHLNQQGDDLLPLGGAFVKYVSEMWDELGPSTVSEITGTDDNNNGLADWWETYAKANYEPEGEPLTWNTFVSYDGRRITAGEAYHLDLAKGFYVDANGNIVTDPELTNHYRDNADVDKDGIPDWWEKLYGIHTGDTDLTTEKHDALDPDNDGLSNYQEYLISYGDSPYGFALGFPILSPIATRSLDDMTKPTPKSLLKAGSAKKHAQRVSDYFLPIDWFSVTMSPEDQAKHFYTSEYLGEILTDHDFMEDWWENQYPNSYTCAQVYDPYEDTDGDGWSNFAECRAFMWGGAFSANLIDRWVDTANIYVADPDDSDTSMKCRPRPAIGVKIVYNPTDQIQEVAGRERLVVRTSTTSMRTDATFVIHGTDSFEDSTPDVSAPPYIVGAYYDAVPVHGFLNPGCILPTKVMVKMAVFSAGETLWWKYTFKDDPNDDDWIEMSGTYEEYRDCLRSRGNEKVKLLDDRLLWNDIGRVSSDAEGHFAKIIYCGPSSSSAATIGTLDCQTGEFTLDMAQIKALEPKAPNAIFRINYRYRIGKNWPQTLWLSDPFDDSSASPQTKSNHVPSDETDSGQNTYGNGFVKEGLNTIEAFFDFNKNGRWDDGEPYGMVKDVPVGWHKVPEITIELTDRSPSVRRMAVVATADGEDAAVEQRTTVRIVRKSINGQADATQRVVMEKEFVTDDRAYLTEADVLSAKSPDLDWKYLVADAQGAKIATVEYEIESVTKQEDGSVVTVPLDTFTRTFGNWRPKAMTVAPYDGAPVYTAAPTFTFTADEQATAFEIQVGREVTDANGKKTTEVIYDSGVQMLVGRAPDALGKTVRTFTAPIYVDAPVGTKDGPVLDDGKTYKWRVVAFNSKFNTANLIDFSDWSSFQMDVANKNRNPATVTDCGKVAAIVRYFGPAREEDLTGKIIVEAFENADFTGTPVGQTRVGDLTALSDPTAEISSLDSANVTLMGVKAGIVYLRAYIDLNDNGKWDRFEPWGYANMIGEYGKEYTHAPVYNPKGLQVESSAGNMFVAPACSVIYIEDTDVNKNEIPDCCEMQLFPESEDATSWYEWAGATEGEDDLCAENDVMAYAEVERMLVTLSDDSTYLLCKGVRAPALGDTAVSCNNGVYETVYAYGDLIGLGRKVTIGDPSLLVTATQTVSVVLVHAQVYREFGYDMKTANPTTFTPDADGIDVENHTKCFTAGDKKHLLSYFEAIGAVDAADLLENAGLSFEEYVDNLAAVELKTKRACELWQKYSLKVGDPDNNRDGVADGWQLYVMFGPAGDRADSTPWTSPYAARLSTPGGEGLTWVQEYDGARYPTDPWNAYTIDDRFMIDGVEYVISDKDAYAYHLKHFAGEEGDKYADFDNDGLANYDEYVIRTNGNRLLDADKMCSFDGYCVPDYFLKSTKRNVAASELAGEGKVIKDYLGFDTTGHDFIESWWKDQYGLSRMTFDPYGDADGDGWDAWNERQAGTNPRLVAALSLDGEQMTEHPVPVLAVTTMFDGTMAPGGSLVIEAYANGSASQVPDARWTVGGKAETQEGEDAAEEGKDDEGDAGSAASRFIGMNPNRPRNYSFGPGKVVPASFKIMIKDPNFDHVNWQYKNGTLVYSVGWAHSADDASWVELCNDRVRQDDQTMGDIIRGGNVVGWINYETGAAYIDFTKLQEDQGFGSASDTTDEQGNVVTTGYSETHHTAQSYVKLTWRGKMLALGGRMSFSLSEPEPASEKSAGLLRQGLNTIVAFVDQNGNGEYDPGEAFGVVKDVDVGFDKVADLNISLTATSPVLPRFKPSELAQASSNSTEGAFVLVGTNNVPVIADKDGRTQLRIVRNAINGVPCFRRVLFNRTVDADATITEADVLAKGRYGFDWNYLVSDAAQLGFTPQQVKTVEYVVFAGEAGYDASGRPKSTLDDAQAIGAIVKTFEQAYVASAPVSPSATASALVTETRPTFEFKAPDSCSAFAFQLLDEAGEAVFASTNFVATKSAEGNVTYRPPVFFGWDETPNAKYGLLPNGRYAWHVAALNDLTAGVTDQMWSEKAEFTVQLGDGKALETDRGILDVTVRYYGDATVDADHPIVVQAFKTADFTGVPEGQAVITDTALLNSYDNTNAVNAKIFGLMAGDYYVRAFVDTTNDCVKSRWESWGYQNNVGTERTDLYTPVSTAVGRNVTGTALVFMEDMDANGDKIPDWMEGWPEEAGVDTDGDGLTDDEELSVYGTDPYLWDTDGDGMPDGWEAKYALTDPLTADGDVAEAGDAMAYLEVEMDFLEFAAQGIGILREGTKSTGWRYYLSYNYGNAAATAIPLYGRGRELTAFAGLDLDDLFKDADAQRVTVALVHDQVLDYVGEFDRTAAVAAGLDGGFTKPFTALDKYLVLRYREAMGELDGLVPADFSPKYVFAGMGEAYVNESRLWSGWTLKPGEKDADGDAIADGWELYVGANPWDGADRDSDWDGDGVTLYQEYDHGDPTDPSADFTVAADLADADAYRFHLKSAADQLADFDNDGLSNWAEYLATKAGPVAFDPDDAFSVSRAAGDGFVPDYFVKTADGKYVGEALDAAGTHLIADHDFMEDAWEDLYDVTRANRYTYDPYDDNDGDGWSNYAEARAKTDPTAVAKSAIDGYETFEYPVPIVGLCLTTAASLQDANGSIVVCAYSDAARGAAASPDATWLVGERAGGANEKFLGFNPGVERHYNFGGSIVPGTFRLEFKDLTADHESYLVNTNTGAKTKLDTLKVSESDNVWADAIIDTKVDSQSSEGYLVDRRDGNTVYGSINYDTGDVTIRFDWLGEAKGQKDAWRTWNVEKTECVVTYYWKSYVRASWTTKAGSTQNPHLMNVFLSDAGTGHLREGRNTFVAYADSNGNGTHDPGELLGVARDVIVGWDRVPQLDIELTDDAAAFPRFAVDASNETVRIVRLAINDTACQRTVWQAPKGSARTLFTEADYVIAKWGELDFDWTYLDLDASYVLVPGEDVRTATYAVMVGTNVVDTYVKEFAAERTQPTAVSPTAARDNVMLTAQPTFVWLGGEGMTAFVLELSTDEGFAPEQTRAVTNFLPAAFSDGYHFTPVWTVGRELVDDTTYYWHVAELNAKFREGAGGWSETATFKTGTDSTRANTGYGKLAAEVRYYGPAKAALSDVIVGVYENADFLGQPVARKVLGGASSVSSLATKVADPKKYAEATANVTFDGLRPGSYYVMAFIDANGNGERDAYETWGYVCKVATDSAALWSPVALDVVSHKAEIDAKILVMEDTDLNKNLKPDCLEDWKKQVIPPYPVYSEIPEAPESPEIPVPTPEPVPEDPEWPGAGFEPDPIDGDLMAYAEEPALFVKIGKSDLEAKWYAVVDLFGEGVKLRDSDIPLQTPASELDSVFSIWNMSSAVGIGTNVKFAAGDGNRVFATKPGTIALVHAQVYAKYGYETGCAAACADNADPRLEDGIAQAKHPHSKPFTVLDKYYVCRYLENIGVAGFDEAEMIRRVRQAELDGEDTMAIWDSFTILPFYGLDRDRDDVADGWELYTMFGTTDLRTVAVPATGLADLKISPFNAADGLKLTAPTWGDPSKPRTPEKGLLLVEEFDGGYYPTDPWSVDTDRDSVIDYYAYQYHLKGNDAGKDFDWTVLPDGTRTWPGKYVDGDGLSNYAEYLISEVFKYAKLSADEMYSSDGVHDYFRKMGDLYLGEVFTDHDQIDDAWEGKYAEYANRDVYDPDRDDDLDGWSNYTEFRAGTDPTKKVSRGLGSYVKQEYPIPVIEAKVVYNGADINLGALVFKAWNDADDAGMTSAPDAIWTFGAVEKEEKSAPGGVQEAEKTEVETSEKYVGPRPYGVQRYALGGGSVVHGSVVVKVCDEGFVRTTASNDVDNAALWYVAAADKAGKIVSYAGTEIGTIDYDSGLLTLDYSKLSGGADGNYSQGQLVRDGLSDELIQTRDRISLDRSNVLITWNASQIDIVPGGTYYLAESDSVGETAKSHGHVREGLNTFMCFADTDGSGDYTPGEPFGVVRGVDVGWQGAKFTVELTETAAIADRIRLTDNADDRKSTIEGALGAFLNDRMLWAIPEVLNATNDAQRAELVAFYANVISNRVQMTTVGAGMKSRVRIVRYGIDDMFCYSAGVYDSGLGMGYDQRVVMEKEFDMNGRDFVSEADFLGPDAFDIDWGTMTGEIVDASGNAIAGVDQASLDVTNMTYLVVVGDGAKDFRGSDDTNAIVSVAGVITRRFERQRSIPACVGIRGGAGIEPAGTVFTAHPTFVWSMPNEDAWASRFGSSYTAFKIRIYDANNDLVYESAMTRAPAQDAEGRFVWTAPISVGGQTPQGKIFANNATYTWCVSMYNAKFRSENADAWSPDGTFSTSVNAQSPMNDAGSSSIGVTVKYTGPVAVLDGCENLTEEVVNGWGAKISAVKGVVRVQAFETADFSGQPVAETQIANRLALTDVTDDLVNGTLTGLKAGTYHIRAYIDQNGNFQKDDFESWGYAKEPVTVGPDVIRLPAVSFFIEDADTNGNVYPDAWEYAYLNDWSESWDAIKDKEAAELRPNGEIILSSAIYEQLANGLAGVSTGVSGSRVTVFQSTWFSELILDTYLNRENAPTTTTTFDAIRKAVEKKIVDKTLKVTAITLDAENKQVILAVDAEVDYANLVAGKFASRLYDLTAMGIDNATCTVKVKVYKKSTLCQEKWDLVEEVEKTFGRDEVSVPVELGKEVDLTGGFYKVEVVQ